MAALRARLAGLAVCATGTVDVLSATATGYHRTAGSFITDGFQAGEEVTPTGFTQTTTGVITAVTAADLTVAGGRTVQAVGAARSLAVVLPSKEAPEGVTYAPTAGVPFWEADYMGGPAFQRSFGGVGGVVEVTPMWVVKIYTPTSGAFLAAGRAASDAYADAILGLFPPKLGLTLSTGDLVRVRTDVAPYRGQLQPSGAAGFAVVTVTIPLRGDAVNTL